MNKLTLGGKELEVNQASLFAIYENYDVITWYVHLKGAKAESSEGEEEQGEAYLNDIQINSLDFGDVYLPFMLEGKTIELPEDDDEEDSIYDGDYEDEALFEHALSITGEDAYLHTLSLTMENWDIDNNKMLVKGKGTLELEEGEDLQEFVFEVNADFKEVTMVETTEEKVAEFLLHKMKVEPGVFEIEYEQSPVGLICRLKAKEKAEKV